MFDVSIIVPTFNSKQTITKAINSIFCQNIEGLELIVVNDGSTDGTGDFLESLVCERGIKYIFKPNGGASSARNFGIEHTTGEFIGFLDADDIFLPGMLSSCLKEILQHGLDLVTVNCYTNHHQNDGSKPRIEVNDYGWIKQAPDLLFLDFMKRGAIGSPQKALFRREVFNKVGMFDTTLKVYEDLDFWIRVARAGLRWGHISAPLVEYNLWPSGSLFTSDRKLNQDCRVAILRRYKAEAIALDPQMKRILGEQLLNFGKNYLIEYKQYRKACSCFLESFLTDPELRRFFRSGYHFLNRFKSPSTL